MTLTYNDSEGVRQAFSQYGDRDRLCDRGTGSGQYELHSTGDPDFLQTLRDVCTASGAVLILDEVMTGFRLGLQGAQGYYGVEADLTTLGKVIGGGMPVGAFGGKREIMEQIAPLGPVYQAGTLSGNPIAMAAGLATLEAHFTAGIL